MLGLQPDSSLPTETDERRPPDRADHVGPYRILETLGEGGMGIVYLAEQTEPIRRRVALKVIRPGMDTSEVLARFDAERQALAVMSHPNVARVFDAGVTGAGRPYFVMEYVPGIRITEYCDMRCLSLRERLELFTRVCGAIQHAHQKGVIHRDIKPSNVMVSTEDGKPVPKVIDFGLAKATGPPLTARTLFTRQGAVMGTPEYMSPEQASGTGLDVDARSDIYSLGVLLYELLVGALPFDAATLRRAAAVEMLRIIQEEEPPKPTTKFDSLGEAAPEVARRRQTDVRSLARQIRGELEWITLRAIEKDPDRRYASASELASEVKRHLADEPVAAGPPSRLYRLRKLVRRHRGAVAAAALSFALLLAGVLVSTSLYLRSEAARRHAETEARRNALETEALQAALLGDARRYVRASREAMDLQRSLAGKGGQGLSSYAVNRLTFLEMFRSFLPTNTDYEGGPELRREALELVHQALERGEPGAVKAAALLTDLLDAGDADALARLALAQTRGAWTGADQETLESMERLIRRLQPRTGGPHAAGDDDALEQVHRESLARSRRVFPAGSPTLVETQKALAAVLERKGSRLLRAGHAQESAPALREALDLLGNGGPVDLERMAKLRSDLGAALVALARFGEAETLLLEAIAVLEKERGGNNASTQVARYRLASLYAAWKRPSEAARVRALLPDTFVEEAWDLGPLPFDETASSREGAYSALVGGRSLWVSGETRTSRTGTDGSTLRQATLGWTEDLDARKGLATLHQVKDSAGVPSEVLPLTRDEAAFNTAHNGSGCAEPCGVGWVLAPAAVVADTPRDRLLVFYRRMLRRGSEKTEQVGASLAVWTAESRVLDRPAVRPETEAPSILFGPDEPAWGSAALVVADQMYAYACQKDEGLDSSCRVARVPLAAALDRTAWRFFAGDGRWSPDWKDARPVLAGGIQSGLLSVHWNPYFGQFMAVCSRVLDARIAIRLANHPEGPWSSPDIEIDTLRSGPGFIWTNLGLGHPELARDGGRTEYLSYWRNLGSRHIRLMEVRFGRK